MAVCAIAFLWCAVVMVAQAFKDNDKKHYAAIAVAMVPPVADYMYSLITGALSLANLQTAIQASGFIHRASLGFYPTTQYAIGYLVIAILAFIFHAGRTSWFKAVEDFEYV